jgi:hypothetical protein
MKLKQMLIPLSLILVCTFPISAKDHSFKTEEDIHYYPALINESDHYINERCVLDLYYPKNAENFTTIVWFQGGGLRMKYTGQCLCKIDSCSQHSCSFAAMLGKQKHKTRTSTMAMLHIYAKMADNVYEVPNHGALLKDLPGWGVFGSAGGSDGFTGGTVHNSGFKGCIYTGPNEVVVAFKGTGGGKLFQDVLADAKIAAGVVPREASAAHHLYERANTAMGGLPGRPITLLGHSLGGGLAQVIAHWHKARFITFNAPAMGSTVQKAKINFFKPQQMVRAIRASSQAGAVGYNYRVQGDPVSSRRLSALGHYGNVITIKTPLISGMTPLSAHSMTRFHDYLSRSSDGYKDPFL